MLKTPQSEQKIELHEIEIQWLLAYIICILFMHSKNRHCLKNQIRINQNIIHVQGKLLWLALQAHCVV